MNLESTALGSCLAELGLYCERGGWREADYLLAIHICLKFTESQKVQFIEKTLLKDKTKKVYNSSHTQKYLQNDNSQWVWMCCYVCVSYFVDAGSRQGGFVQVIKVRVSHGLTGGDPLGRIVGEHFLQQRRQEGKGWCLITTNLLYSFPPVALAQSSKRIHVNSFTIVVFITLRQRRYTACRVGYQTW